MRVVPIIVKAIKAVLPVAFLCFFNFYKSYAQASSVTSNPLVTIKGVVIDSDVKTALSRVSVIVQRLGKSQPFKGTHTTDSGTFEIAVLPNMSYQLLFTYVGYKDTSITLSALTSSTINVGQIPLVSLAQQLKEVQVVIHKPLIEQDLDKLTYNVDADPESKSATALEILRKIPMLTLDADDNLKLNGNENYRVLINGKPSSLFLHNKNNVFRNMPANMMKTIEVITVPSSRYEAQGIGGIINITTYKKSISGYNGGINLQASNPKGYTASGNVTVSLGKLSLSGNYNYSSITSPPNNNTFYRQDKLHQSKLEQVGTNHNNSWSQNWGSGLTYELNSLNLLTASYGNNTNNSYNNSMQEVVFLNTAGIMAESYKNLNAGKNKSMGNDLAFDYEHSFKRNDAQLLTLSYRWNNINSSNNSDFIVQPLFNYKGQTSISNNKDGFSEQSIQADYVQPIKKHTLECGISTIWHLNNSDYFYKSWDTVTYAYVLDTSQSNNFNYKEGILTAYISLDLRMDKWGFRTGVRGEQAKVDAHFLSSGTLTIKEYKNLIPSITLSRRFKGQSILKLSYTQRIQRPDLYYLDPYIDLTDSRNISYGNPNLQPALGHVFEIAYNTFIKKTSFNINISHQFTNNAIEQITTLGADTIARTTFGNIGQNKNLSLSLSGNSLLFKRLSISLNSSTNYVQYAYITEGKPHRNEGLMYNIIGTANIRFKGWNAGTTLSYTAPAITIQGKSSRYITHNIVLNRHLFKDNKVNIGLSVSNPLREHQRTVTEINDLAFYQLRESVAVIRRFNISLSYRFTKVQGKQKP